MLRLAGTYTPETLRGSPLFLSRTQKRIMELVRRIRMKGMKMKRKCRF